MTQFRLLRCACIFSACRSDLNLELRQQRKQRHLEKFCGGGGSWRATPADFYEMEKNLKNNKEILINRLTEKGVDPQLTPGFIRILANCLSTNPHATVENVNSRLRYFGWEDFELDYHTLSLAISCFEEEGLHRLRYIPPALTKAFVFAMN